MIEQISPELVLVCPELRAAALATLPGSQPVVGASPSALDPASAPTRPILVEAVAYTVWQMLVSALTALTAVTVVAVAVVLIGFVVH
jgi:hypothetical protein